MAKIYLKKVDMNRSGECRSELGQECWFKNAAPKIDGLYSCNTKYRHIIKKHSGCDKKVYIQVPAPDLKS